MKISDLITEKRFGGETMKSLNIKAATVKTLSRVSVAAMGTAVLLLQLGAPVHAAYVANYSLTDDVPAIVGDDIGIALVSSQPLIPGWVKLLGLVLTFLLLV